MIHFSEFREDTSNDQRFSKLLQETIPSASNEVLENFSFFLSRLTKEKSIDYEKAFAICLKYFSMIMEKFHIRYYRDIAFFIKDNIKKKPNDCIEILKTCIKKELCYYAQHQDVNEYSFAYIQFRQILTVINENIGDKEFIEIFNLLLDYPKDIIVMPQQDLEELTRTLIHIDQHDVGSNEILSLLEKIVSRYTFLYKYLEEYKKSLSEEG